MKLVVGLGNPGEKYKNTRHNVGFGVVERLAGEGEWKISKSSGALLVWVEIGREKIELMKPQKFMNRSGVAAAAAKKKHPELKDKDIYIIHDDLDIRLGEYKFSFGRGPKDHNGLKSVYEQLGSKEFWHVRMGVDNRMKIPFKGSGEEYVLSSWLPEERKMVENMIEKIAEELKNVLA
jgi:PTH1 family peptidyl-tRNA hydrolase